MAAKSKAGTSSTKTGTATKAGTASKTSTKPEAKRADRKVAEGAVTYVRQTSERAVDVPVGAILIARERLNDAVQPWTTSEARERELRSMREQARRELRKFERRGGQARRRAGHRVRRTRTQVERRVRKVETTVKENRSRVEGGLKRAQISVQERVSALA